MYFGLIEVPTYYMVFMEYLDKFVIVFINGILVYSKSEEEHEEYLHLVSQKLQDPRFYVKISKCEFWMKQVTFMSHVILEQGISMDSSTIQDMVTWNTTTSVTNIQSFLRISRILSEDHRRILKDHQADDRVAWEG
jgi:hypothetical protein